MKKNTRNIILALFFLVILGILAVNALNISSQKQKEKELVEQRALVIKQAQKAAKDAEEKIYLMGKFDPTQETNFVLIQKEYTTNGSAMYLRKETFDAFLLMKKTAEDDGINLKIAFATRNFDYQKNIWNSKWNGTMLVDGKNLSKSIPDGLDRFIKILEYSAAPGTSRHHWGTDIDINAATPEYFEGKEGIKVYDWLTQNASSFGFCQPYSLKGDTRSTGYNEEKWHWSYKPLSKTFTEDYKKLINDKDITGFSGDEYASKLNLINDYVLGINPDCL